jgi:hypothetical protein
MSVEYPAVKGHQHLQGEIVKRADRDRHSFIHTSRVTFSREEIIEHMEILLPKGLTRYSTLLQEVSVDHCCGYLRLRSLGLE